MDDRAKQVTITISSRRSEEVNSCKDPQSGGCGGGSSFGCGGGFGFGCCGCRLGHVFMSAYGDITCSMQPSEAN